MTPLLVSALILYVLIAALLVPYLVHHVDERNKRLQEYKDVGLEPSGVYIPKGIAVFTAIICASLWPILTPIGLIRSVFSR